MFTVPDGPDFPLEGTSEETPLFLESIKADELREFIRVLSCRCVCWGGILICSIDSEQCERLLAAGEGTPIRSIPTSWMPVLKLASLWDFPKLRIQALKYLKSQDCMTRLIMSRQYNVDEWFLPALKEVAVRAKPLTAGEVNELGLDFALQVMALREKVRGAPCLARFVSAKSH